MRIAVASDGLNIAPRFSLCKNFNYYNAENGQLVDSHNLPSQGHRCDSQASFLEAMGVQVLICDGIASSVVQSMNDHKIEVITGASGNALSAAKDYLAKTFTEDAAS